MLVQQEVPCSRHYGRNDLAYLVARTEPVEDIDYEINCERIEQNKKAILDETDTLAVTSTKSKNALQRVIETKANEEGDRSCEYKIDKKHLMEKHKQPEVDGERNSAHHNESRDLTIEHKLGMPFQHLSSYFKLDGADLAHAGREDHHNPRDPHSQRSAALQMRWNIWGPCRLAERSRHYG